MKQSNSKNDNIIMFEQQGEHLLEGELLCEVCGYKGRAMLGDVIAHKRGFHRVNSL